MIDFGLPYCRHCYSDKGVVRVRRSMKQRRFCAEMISEQRPFFGVGIERLWH
jgi:hypothetical protein